jgi:hypothetical protein
LQPVYSFPSLVPYDWCLQLFVTALQENLFSPPFQAKRALIIEQLPPWAAAPQVDSTTMEESVHGLGPRNNLPLTKHFESFSLNSSICTELVLKRQQTETYRPFLDELKWLGMFTEVVTWTEEQDPELVLKKGV